MGGVGVGVTLAGPQDLATGARLREGAGNRAEGKGSESSVLLGLGRPARTRSAARGQVLDHQGLAAGEGQSLPLCPDRRPPAPASRAGRARARGGAARGGLSTWSGTWPGTARGGLRAFRVHRAGWAPADLGSRELRAEVLPAWPLGTAAALTPAPCPRGLAGVCGLRQHRPFARAGAPPATPARTGARPTPDPDPDPGPRRRQGRGAGGPGPRGARPDAAPPPAQPRLQTKEPAGGGRGGMGRGGGASRCRVTARSAL